MYYTEFDWLSDAEIAEVLPEDGVPETLVIQDLNGVTEPTGLTRAVFQSWLHEGRHDCDAAKEMLRFWFYVRPGSSHDTEADFFDQLYHEYAETLPEEDRRRRPRRRGGAEAGEDDAAQEDELPVTFLAQLLQSSGYVPFDPAGHDAEAVATELCSRILEEVAKVQACVAAWRGSTLVPNRRGQASPRPRRRPAATPCVRGPRSRRAPWR